MNLPLTPPTDSLYKFQAVSGLILVITMTILPIIKLNEIEAHINKTGRDIGVTQADEGRVNTLNDLLQIHLDSIKRHISQAATLPSTQLEQSDLDGLINEDKNLELELRAFVDTFTDVQEKAAAAIAENDYDHTLAQDEKGMESVYYHTGLFGWAMWIGGSLMWLLRIQWPQDELLRLQIAKAKADARPTPDASPKRSSIIPPPTEPSKEPLSSEPEKDSPNAQ
jgi:hypothetical protein